MINDKYRMNLMGELKSIILSTDGSEFSEGAIREAINFARACRTKLTVLYVIEFNPEYETIAMKYVEERELAVNKHFSSVRDKAAEENVECDIVLRRTDEVYEAIVDEAVKKKADVIIMGRRGMTGLKKLLMGSVTAKTIAYAPCKVLVVPKDTDIKGENILLATDGSSSSEMAETEAINLAARCPFVKNFTAVSVATSEQKKKEAETVLARVKNNAEKRGVSLETLTLTGEPYKAIVNASLETSADIVIMGTHGRTGISKLLMGSVAERVVGLAQCAILVCRPV